MHVESALLAYKAGIGPDSLLYVEAAAGTTSSVSSSRVR